MKYFVYILTVLMLSVIFVPCSDEPGANIHLPQFNTEHNISDNHHDHDHSDTQDSCSPFCYCQCCSVASLTLISITEVSIQSLDSTPSRENMVYSNHYSYVSKNSLFQPPRA
ncbi:MAG: DUF6660 family protein [Flavobacteriales bacterium]